MKDTILTLSARRKKQELVVLVLCFVAANIINLAAIIHFDTSWMELLSQMGYVVIITIILYVVIWMFRLLFSFLFHKRHRSA